MDSGRVGPGFWWYHSIQSWLRAWSEICKGLGEVSKQQVGWGLRCPYLGPPQCWWMSPLMAALDTRQVIFYHSEWWPCRIVRLFSDNWYIPHLFMYIFHYSLILRDEFWKMMYNVRIINSCPSLPQSNGLTVDKWQKQIQAVKESAKLSDKNIFHKQAKVR